jgi:signal transduction histidine kinase
MVLLGLAAVLLAGGAYAYSRHTLSRELSDRMILRAASLERVYATGGEDAVVTLALRLAERGTRTFAYTLVDPHGQLVIGVAGAAHQPIGWSTLPLSDLDDGEMDVARVLTRRLPDGARIAIVADTDFIDQFDIAVFGSLIASFALLLAAGLVGALLLDRIVRGRLEAIAGTARSIIAGDTASRIALSGRGDEFDAVCAVLNAMLDARDEAIANVRRITGYIAHDLRAPVVRLRQDLARSGAGSSDTAQYALDRKSAVARCDEILEIYEAILAIGEVEAFGIGKGSAPFSLSALMDDLGDSFADALHTDGRTLTTAIAPDIVVDGNRGLMTQLIVNLLDNAATHTPPGTVVTMRLEANATETRIVVSDDGAGLMPAEAAAREREGLGLRLVEAIARAHGGTVVVTPGQPGMTVAVTLPAASEDRRQPGQAGLPPSLVSGEIETGAPALSA